MAALIVDDVEIERRLEKLDRRYRNVSRLLELAHNEHQTIARAAGNGVLLAYTQNRIIQLSNMRDTIRNEIDRLEDDVDG